MPYRRARPPTRRKPPGAPPGWQLAVQKPTPDGFTQVPSPAPKTGALPPPVGAPAPPERPVLDPTGAPYANQQTAGAYTTGAQSEALARNAGQTHQQVRQAAVAYAQQRLAALRHVAGVAGDPELQQILSQGGDVLKVYAAASARWTKLARDAGYADPRVWLRDMIARTQAARPSNPQPQ